MNSYLLPVVALVAISVAAYGISTYFNGFSMTGFSVNNQPNGNMTQASDEEAVQSIDDAIETPTCPDSCDDKDPCTSDRCNELTDYSCVHEKISGCCNLGKAYCDGKCVPVKCIVDKDCDDGNRYTEDACVNPNSCGANCEHSLIQNVCGNGVCEGNESYSSCKPDCGALAPKDIIQGESQNISGDNPISGQESNVLKVSITTADQTYPNYKGNVTITILVTSGNLPVYGSNINASVRYASNYTKKTYGITDENGMFVWNFIIGSSKPGVRAGTFNASVAASKDGYEAVYNHTLFYVTEAT